MIVCLSFKIKNIDNCENKICYILVNFSWKVYETKSTPI
jgi:hypothetical protein